VPLPIFGKIGISFSSGYGFPLSFEYAGNTFSGTSSYKEVWTSFGNGLKLNLTVHFPVNSNVSIISGIDGMIFGSLVLPKSSGTYHYQDEFSQTLGGVYGGLETVGTIRRWILSVSLEPGIYYPYNVTVLRQHRIDDKYSNGNPYGDVISDTYHCYYHPSPGISSSLRFGYKTTRNIVLFLSVRPSVVHARLKGYEQNINGEITYYPVENGYIKPFGQHLESGIRENFPMDFSSIAVSVGIEYFSRKQ
jgi:hypothetical protein